MCGPSTVPTAVIQGVVALRLVLCGMERMQFAVSTATAATVKSYSESRLHLGVSLYTCENTRNWQDYVHVMSIGSLALLTWSSPFGQIVAECSWVFFKTTMTRRREDLSGKDYVPK